MSLIKFDGPLEVSRDSDEGSFKLVSMLKLQCSPSLNTLNDRCVHGQFTKDGEQDHLTVLFCVVCGTTRTSKLTISKQSEMFHDPFSRDRSERLDCA